MIANMKRKTYEASIINFSDCHKAKAETTLLQIKMQKVLTKLQ